MRAELKRIHSPDVDCLESYTPEDPVSFGVLVQAMVGPEGEDAEESFDFMLCTPAWLQAHMPTELVPGRHHLFVRRYRYEELVEFLKSYCSSCEGGSWRDLALKVGRLGKWEFEDYTP